MLEKNFFQDQIMCKYKFVHIQNMPDSTRLAFVKDSSLINMLLHPISILFLP